MANATTTRDRADQQEDMREAPAGNVPATTGRQHPIVAFQQYAAERAEQLNFALPAHISPERFTRVLMTALQRKASLLACTKQSLWNACMLAAQDGLLPDGREGAIVPYGENENGQKKAEIATWMPMIEGLRKKARNSGEISDWTVQVVRSRDHFRFALGDNAFIEHEPYFGLDDPGEVVGAYSIATMKDGAKSREVMSRRDLDAIRSKSRATKGPWGDPVFFAEMCRKTVARRHYKQLPHSSDLDEMIARDDQAFGLEDRSNDQIEQRQQRRQLGVAASFDQFAGPADAGGAAIDHDSATGEVADFDNGSPEPEAQPEPKPAPKADPKPKLAAEKPKPAAKQVEQPEPQDSAQDQQGGPETSDTVDSADGPVDQADATDGPAGSGDAAFDAGIDADARVWPPGQVPSDPDEYEMYLDTVLAQATDPRALQNKFVTGDKDLRAACRISQPDYLRFSTKVKARMAELGGARR